jgi:MFS family permease
MRPAFDLLRSERRARVFFLALAQSALGTGAGYIALILVAEQRFTSPWAITLVLVADFIPAMLLGPLFGTLADRWSRKWCVIAGDVVRAVALASIVLVDSIEATVALAVVAGTGTGLFTPAALAALPSVIDDKRRLPAATALYSMVPDLGFILGPAIGAAVLLIGDISALLWFNSATFLLSAAILVPLRFGAVPERAAGPRSPLLTEVRDGLRATAGMPTVRVVLGASIGATFCAGLLSIAELFYAVDEIGTSMAGFSALVSLFGVGFIAGSLAGSHGGTTATLKRRYLAGVAILGAGLIATGLVSSFPLALATFALAGFGNGLVLVYQRLLIQDSCPESLFGRVFGIAGSLGAWAFAASFVAGGALVSTIGAGEVILLAGVACLFVAALASLVLRPRSGDSVPERAWATSD